MDIQPEKCFRTPHQKISKPLQIVGSQGMSRGVRQGCIGNKIV